MYPPEAQKLNVVEHLEELRRRILISLAVLVCVSGCLFVNGKQIMLAVKNPLDILHLHLIFITPTEVFTAYLRVSFLFGFILSFPFLLYQVWAFLAPAISRTHRKNIILWMVLAIICFVIGILFSYYIALPVALKFLIHFGQALATPQITVAKYVSFFSALILLGGLVFEIPVFLGLLTDLGLIKSKMLKEKRQYALLIILIVAAVITPTQDIINMGMFALPMILLYEIGILISQFVER